MPDPPEKLAFLRSVQARRATTRQTFRTALLFAIQVVISSALLLWGYHLAHANGAIWAVASAILVVQPRIEQALSTSAVRIAANIVGGVMGFAIGEFFGTGPIPLLTAITATVIIAELLRLDLGLRTACVATVIVMTTSEGHVATSSIERHCGVLIGCLVAVMVQMLAEALRRILGWKNSRPKSSAVED